MGRTYKRNKGWKKDKHDNGFKKSKKFKEFTSENFKHPKKEFTHNQLPPEIDDDI